MESSRRNNQHMESFKSIPYVSKAAPHTCMAVVPLADDFVPEDTEIVNGVEYERVEEFHIDVNSIPDHVRESLAAATLDFIKRMLRDPNSRSELEKRLADKGDKKSIQWLNDHPLI